MKNILTQIFVALGVIFLILILVGIYFFVTDPLNVKPMIFGGGQPINMQEKKVGTDTTKTDTSTTTISVTPVSGGFQLSDAQKQALVTFGIDPAVVPSSISTEQEMCFVSVLGEARVEEIKAGAVPSAIEFFRAKACI